jgi:hypothetical protein
VRPQLTTPQHDNACVRTSAGPRRRLIVEHAQNISTNITQARRAIPRRQRQEPVRGTRRERLHGSRDRDIAEQTEQATRPGIHLVQTGQWGRPSGVPGGEQGDRPRERGVRLQWLVELPGAGANRLRKASRRKEAKHMLTRAGRRASRRQGQPRAFNSSKDHAKRRHVPRGTYPLLASITSLTTSQDIGYGSIENGKGKAASFEKAKKEAATDGLKRSLRTFGNVLGNCLYDKEYLKKVQSMKCKPIKFQEDNLYRHVDFAPPAKEEPQAMVKREAHRTPVRPNQALRTRTEALSNESFGADFDDEADENLFDGVDITEDHRDDFSFSETLSAPEATAPRVEPVKPNGLPSARTSPIRSTDPPRQPNGRPLPAQAGRGQPPVQQQQPTNQGPGRPPFQMGKQPQTPIQQPPRPVQNGGRMPPPAAENGAASRPIGQHPQNPQQQPPNQPLRPTPPQAQQAPNQQRPGPQAPGVTTPAANAPPPNHRPPVGFVTSRAAELLQASDAPTSINHLPSFNPNAESPIPLEKRTPGVDHARSGPIKRDNVGAPVPPPQPAGRPGATSAGGFNRPNIVNPHLDANRRIGVPGAQGYAMSPSANRGAYKPPTFANGQGPNGVKRERGVLQDVSNVGTNGGAGTEGPDAKRQKVDGALGAENAGVVGA